jgi:hypothetical protein
MTQQIWTVFPVGARCIVASIYWRRNNLLSFFLLSLCLHSLSHLSISASPSPSPSPSPFTSPSPSSSPRYLHLPPLHRETKNIYNGGKQYAAFCLFMGTSPKKCGLLGGNGNTLKLKTTTKLKDKRTTIAAVRGLYRMYATFLTPLGSHCRLPLRICLFGLKYYGTGFMEPHWDHNNVFGWSSSSSKKNLDKKKDRSTAIDHVDPFSLYSLKIKQY